MRSSECFPANAGWIDLTLDILREGGPLALHLEREPVSARVAGVAIPLTHSDGSATPATIPVASRVTLVLDFALP